MKRFTKHLVGAGQAIDRELDAFKYNATPRARLGLRAAGLGASVMGAYGVVKGYDMLVSHNTDPDSAAVTFGVSSIVSLQGVAMILASMPQSTDRIHWQERRTPSQVYHAWAIARIENKILDHKNRQNIFTRAATKPSSTMDSGFTVSSANIHEATQDDPAELTTLEAKLAHHVCKLDSLTRNG